MGAGGGSSNGGLKRPEDSCLRMVASIAYGTSSPGSDICPDASDEEMQFFLNARKHLPKTLSDPEPWKQAAGAEWWRRAVSVRNRGGR